ncbi:metallophosphoesterase [Sphingomonas koreensis]|nr:metallophosphoesterase [Sphingomonas koreensis]
MIRLFHVSDIHFGAEDRAALDWFAACVADEQPDAIVMTGDLTMRARSHEFAAAAAWLEALGRPLTIEVGNHDLPAFNMLRRLFRPYHRYGKVERALERPLAIEGIAIVPLRTTSRFQWRLNWSKGRVSDHQLGKTLAEIDDVPDDALVIVACHHPLIDAGTQSTARTAGGGDALGALARAGAQVVLSGHVHDPFDVTHETADGTVRLIGAGTLSERTRASPAAFNELRISGRDLDLRVRTFGE